ncbi:sphingosine-1-phosphate phosphatase 2 isoform X2 [Engystomops pustulosus]|uniref:sphingosine-1-phosphate phosphatase 2 isoform X2 n=1 Tax=Engystomops pustulosus TaxID=76066 RepID=UPI003AFB1902
MALPLLLETLQDPQLVAQFQRLCGLTLKPKGEVNGVALGYSSTQTLQGGREKTAGVKGVPQENGHKPYINGTYTNGTHRQIVMYIGQASKDLLKWPRPSSPPVVKLETRVEAEYGMPSTHAIAATAISFTFLMAAVDRYQFPFVLGFVAALFLSTLVSLSRLYTGMHTVLDVICGALIALLFIAVTFPVWDVMDQLILTNPICPVFAVVAGFLLSYNYPKLDHYSTTRADTTVILGVGAGTCVGVWIINLIGLTYVPLGVFPLGIPLLTYPMLLRQLLRFVLGVTLLVITRFIAKTLSLKALGSWYKVSTQDVLVRQKLEIEVPYKFVTYTSIGVVATSIVPWIYYLVNL